MQTVDDKTVISGLRWYASDQYGLLITVRGVGDDFSQTEHPPPGQRVDITDIDMPIAYN